MGDVGKFGRFDFFCVTAPTEWLLVDLLRFTTACRAAVALGASLIIRRDLERTVDTGLVTAGTPGFRIGLDLLAERQPPPCRKLIDGTLEFLRSMVVAEFLQ